MKLKHNIHVTVHSPEGRGGAAVSSIQDGARVPEAEWVGLRAKVEPEKRRSQRDGETEQTAQKSMVQSG